MDSEREKFLQENLLLLKLKVQEQRLEKIWFQFEEAGFQPILIKGWAAALKYPNPAERLYVDADLVFDPVEFARAEEFIKRNHFDLSIDLHKELRHLDTLDFNILFKNSVIKQCGSAGIRVLSEEDHLRVLCNHWLNDGGADKERLKDIYFAIQNRKKDFDWDKCLGVVNSKRRRWILVAIGITHKYLDLKIDDLPFKDELLEIPKWVIKAIENEWDSGVKLLPINNFLDNNKDLWKQIKKRFPPNPITATIMVEGSIDTWNPLFYQILNIFQRMIPSIVRIKNSRNW